MASSSFQVSPSSQQVQSHSVLFASYCLLSSVVAVVSVVCLPFSVAAELFAAFPSFVAVLSVVCLPSGSWQLFLVSSLDRLSWYPFSTRIVEEMQ